MRFHSIIKVAAVLLTVCGFVLTSCDDSNGEIEVLEVSIKNPSVDSSRGQQFVNVECSGNWTLALVLEQDEADWARLSVSSGTGNKSNVVLSYDVNASECDRVLKIVLDNCYYQVDET